jgi:hypothetical protein
MSGRRAERSERGRPTSPRLLDGGMRRRVPSAGWPPDSSAAVRNGSPVRIGRFRDHWNPLVVIATFGGAGKANAVLKGGSLEPFNIGATP